MNNDRMKSLGDALTRLEEALAIPLDQGRVAIDVTIHRFEFTFELFWKTLKRFLSAEGIEVRSPRETLQKAYQLKWIDNEQLWLNMMRDRNETSHVYDEGKAHKIYDHIRKYTVVLREAYDKLADIN